MDNGPVFNINAITVKQLKDFVAQLPELDENGEDFTVWMANIDQPGLSAPVKSIWPLNKGDVLFENHVE